MRPAIALIDSILVGKGLRTLKDMERCSRDPGKANEVLLMRILRENADTEYGRKYGFGEIRSVEEYRRRVPFSDYDVYAPYIRRMAENKETNLIAAYQVIHYAETSANQVKPVRILDVPMKQKFFFGLLEEGQEVPKWDFYTKK